MKLRCYQRLLLMTGWVTALSVSHIYAQSANQNYIRVLSPREKIAAETQLTNSAVYRDSVETTIQYLDGLGRPIQTVQRQGSPNGSDVVQSFVYDEFGREIYKYLPYAPQTGTGINDGSYKPNAMADQNTFFSTPPAGVSQIADPYAQTNFEPSPLNRVVEGGAPGIAWQPVAGSTAGHTIKTVYTTNNSTAFSADSVNGTKAEFYKVTINANQGRTLIDAGPYFAGQLYVTVTKDENWIGSRAGTTEEYKDKEGHVVLKRFYNYSSATTPVLSTYYVYDKLGNLAFVLPPASGADNAMPTQAILNDLCYQYRYDERNRLNQKKLPGKGWDFMVYNQLDQPVLTQDSVRRLANQWMVNKYDALGRIIMTGLWNAGSVIPLATLQSSIYAGAQWDKRDNTNVITGYNITSYPALTTMLSVNYYDNYNNIPSLPGTYSAPAGSNALPTGALTASKTAVLNTPADMLWDVMYYDDLGRNMESYKLHYLGGTLNTANYDAETTTYNFNNQPTTTIRQHYTTAGLKLTVNNQYLYDYIGRKLETWEQIQNGGQTADTRTLLSKIDYNEIGQVLNKHLHSTDSTTFLQNIAYTYNERGWLLNSSTPLFNEQLQYNIVNGVSGINPKAQYNGNVASQTWASNASTGSFVYTYDRLNRLVAGGSTDHYDERGITYDPMGNINTLNRVYNGTVIDSLTYTYNSANQLQSVHDQSNDAGTIGYKTGSWVNAYAYDGNGNMVSDNSKGITGPTGIVYNILNLPQSISSQSTTYTYDAGGQKLRRVIATANTDYVSGIEYDGAAGAEAITFIQTEEGRAIPNGVSAYNYEYNLADHLGDTRLSFDSSTGIARTVQQDNYMPFGMDISLGAITSPQNRYLYNKKELQDGLGTYDYGARFYDPVIGRWESIDPLAENGRRWSTYNYGLDNPVRFLDPDGQGPTDWVKIGNSVTFYADIHSDEEAKQRFGDRATDVTADDKSFIYEGSNNRQVILYPGSFEHWDYTDGTEPNTVIKKSDPLIAKSEGLETAGKINAGFGLVNSVHGAGVAAAMKSAGKDVKELGEGLNEFKSVTRNLGIVTASVSEFISISDAINHPNAVNFIKLGVNSLILTSEILETTNPAVGIGIALLDATGGTDIIYKKLENLIDPHPGTAGPATPLNPNYHHGSGLIDL